MPELYYAKIPLWDNERGRCSDQSMPFLLPHEVIGHVMEGQDPLPFLTVPEPVQNQIDEMCTQLGCDKASFVATGLHGDGVPHQVRRSVDIISWKVLAKGMHTRFPLCCGRERLALQVWLPWAPSPGEDAGDLLLVDALLLRGQISESSARHDSIWRAR